MRTLVAVVILGLGAGCRPPRPVPAPLPVIHPSILVNPPYPGVTQAGAKPEFPKTYASGNGGSDSDKLAGTFRSWQDYTLARGDRQDVDPKAVADALRRWIEGAKGVTVTRVSDQDPMHQTIDYSTAETVGYATFEIAPAAPAPKVTYSLKVHEQRKH